VTRGFYIEVNKESSEIVSLPSFPGLKLFATAGSGSNRGVGEYKGVLYSVSGTELYKVDTVGSETLIDTLPGVNHCILVEDGINLIITNGTSKPHVYDGTDLTLTTNVNLHNSNSVTFINRRVVYDGPNEQALFANLDDPTVVAGDNIALVETKSDALIRVFAQDQQILMFGDKTIEPFYFTGSGNPPYRRIDNATKEIGLIAIHSVGSNDDFVYFLGSDRRVYRWSGLTIQSISNPAIGQSIAKYSDVSDAKGFCFTLDSQRFYLLTFGIGNETWLFSENAGWTNLAFGADNDEYLAASYINIYGKHLIGDRRNGNIYELDFDTHTHNGDTIFWQRDTAQVLPKAIGAAGREMTINRLRIFVETGTSLITGQGSDAQIMMTWSDDGGRSFSSEQWGSIGAQGEYGTEIFWDDLGTHRSIMFRFRMTDPVRWVLMSAEADIEVGLG
jgi:hypothetical protein